MFLRVTIIRRLLKSDHRVDQTPYANNDHEMHEQ